MNFNKKLDSMVDLWPTSWYIVLSTLFCGQLPSVALFEKQLRVTHKIILKARPTIKTSRIFRPLV